MISNQTEVSADDGSEKSGQQLREALKNEREHRRKLTSALVDYLSGESGSGALIDKVATLLDGPEQRALEASTKAALGEAA